MRDQKRRTYRTGGPRSGGEHVIRVVYRKGHDRRHRDVWASCSCGWRGATRERVWEVRLDGSAHRDGWGES